MTPETATFEVISNMKESVSLGYPNIKKEVDEIQVVWIADEMLSQVFHIYYLLN